ncbi:hypothetical protein IHV25_04105 [Phaeovibrio sulfidiphilus]|uniref:Uncharacterized protein n=1 Tax=Phaeovibrio sulfidiphilus TaxID=1220600 RepID=A0A8J6YMX6_9PROT|nr:hypothetical protein [Phaeovibrio sulfidiphilus]MBE1236834.1 hypothetical protein [Phaeovibrio sulfidiphilus]
MPDTPVSRRGVLFALGALPLVLAVGACSTSRPDRGAPVPTDFDNPRARALADRARAALAAHNPDTAIALARESLQAWPASTQTWGLLREAATAAGRDEDRRLATFFEGRIKDYEAMHPLQARLAFLGAARQPPAATPSIGPWAERLAGYFAWKDARSGKQTGPLR